MKRAMFGLAASALLASTALAGDWEKLGSRVVSFADDHDTLDCTGDGPFTAIRFEVADGNLEMFDVEVILGDGETFSPGTRIQFDENSLSRTIDLPGEARSIRTIEFWYKSERRTGHATVTVFGRVAAGVAEPPDEPRWEKIGSRSIGSGADHDTLDCTGGGPFTALRIEIEDAKIELYDIKVALDNGEDFSPRIRILFDENSRSRTIDLPGEPRFIRTIEFSYRMENRSGLATMTAFAKTVAPRVDLPPDPVPADDRGWEELGSRNVAFSGDHDTIDCTGEGRFTSLRFEVEYGTIELFDIKVTLGNGETFSPTTRMQFGENSHSRTIDLPGRAKTIRKIEFWYRSERRRGRATVTVFGKSAGRRSGSEEDRSWEELGSRVVAFDNDHDTIDCAGDGRFTALRIEVEDGNLEMFDIEVTLGNDETFSPETRLRFDENSRSRTIDLPGRSRTIHKIEFWYKSERRRGHATIHVYGRRPG